MSQPTPAFHHNTSVGSTPEPTSGCRCRCYCDPVCRCKCLYPSGSSSVYSGTQVRADGSVYVDLASNHPGKGDPAYESRRAEIAGISNTWQPGQEPLTVEYTDDENRVWAECCTVLDPLHDRYACQEYLDGKARLGLPTDRVPQLVEVNELLARAKATTRSTPGIRFRYLAAPGLVPVRKFYAALGLGQFFSTQYVRHGGNPLYTPEPDIVHEVIGHANGLANEKYAELTAAAGEATTRLHHYASVKFVADVFWFTFEFGLLKEAGEMKAYGAGILSSSGEMENLFSAGENINSLVAVGGNLDELIVERELAFHDQQQPAAGSMPQPVLRPLNIREMGTLEYDITKYQPVYFYAESWEHLEMEVGGFFSNVTDEMVAHILNEKQ